MPDKIIEITDPQTGSVKETVVAPKALSPSEERQKLMEGAGLAGPRRLREVATTSEFPALLRLGLKQILFDSYDSTPTTFQEWCKMETSDKPAEDYLEMNRFGTLPFVGEGDPYPDADVAVDRAVRVANAKYGMKFGITEEMIKYDKSNQIKQFPTDMGEAAKQTQEATAYSSLTTAGSYTRNSTTNDNDIGSNTGSTTFSAGGLITALATLTTMKDNKSGRYLNIVPDLLIVAPRLEFAAKQLLLSPSLAPVGSGATYTNVPPVYGGGTSNPFRGLVSKILVTPWIGTSYQWVLMKAGRAMVYQEVEPLQLLTGQVDYQNNGAYFNYDRIEYRVRLWFGIGMINDRFCYLSTSTTAPTLF
jgi:hypothetical protein